MPLMSLLLRRRCDVACLLFGSSSFRRVILTLSHCGRSRWVSISTNCGRLAGLGFSCTVDSCSSPPASFLSGACLDSVSMPWGQDHKCNLPSCSTSEGWYFAGFSVVSFSIISGRLCIHFFCQVSPSISIPKHFIQCSHESISWQRGHTVW